METKFDDILKKVEQMKKSGTVDLSTDEDLAIGVMNLISLEEHFFFTAEKTKKGSYFDMANEIREMRKDLLGRMISRDRHEGETWCISKHLLASTMRMIEVGTKLQHDGKKDEAKKLFDYAYKLFTIFFGLRLKLITVPEVGEMAKQDDKAWTLNDIMGKLVNCCDE